jgi:hypothetical protein
MIAHEIKALDHRGQQIAGDTCVESRRLQTSDERPYAFDPFFSIGNTLVCGDNSCPGFGCHISPPRQRI